MTNAVQVSETVFSHLNPEEISLVSQFYPDLQHFLMECRQTKTKQITLANHKAPSGPSPGFAPERTWREEGRHIYTHYSYAVLTKKQ